jgi:hypothetical protein
MTGILTPGEGGSPPDEQPCDSYARGSGLGTVLAFSASAAVSLLTVWFAAHLLRTTTTAAFVAELAVLALVARECLRRTPDAEDPQPAG